MRMPSRGGLINHPKKGVLRSSGGLPYEGLKRRVRMVKTPRKSASAVQQLPMFLGDSPLRDHAPLPTPFALGIPPKAKKVDGKSALARSTHNPERPYARAHTADPRYLERRAMEVQQIKRCDTCRIVKPYSEFYASRGLHTVGGVTNSCKDCMLVRQRTWYMRRTYGIRLEEYASLYEAQDGKCAICGAPGKSAASEKTDHKSRGATSGVLVVDHDHETWEVRGLLYTSCNWGLGHFQDSTALLRAGSRVSGQVQGLIYASSQNEAFARRRRSCHPLRRHTTVFGWARRRHLGYDVGDVQRCLRRADLARHGRGIGMSSQPLRWRCLPQHPGDPQFPSGAGRAVRTRPRLPLSLALPTAWGRMG